MAETLGGSCPPLRSLWFFCHCPEWHLVWILLRASAGSTHLTRGYTSLSPFLLYSSVNCEPVTGPLGFCRSLKLNSRLYYPECVARYSEILTGCSLYSVILHIIVLGYLNICGYYRVCSYGNNFPRFPLICLLVVSVSVFLTVGLTLSACTTSFYSVRNSSRTGKFTQSLWWEIQCLFFICYTGLGAVCCFTEVLWRLINKYSENLKARGIILGEKHRNGCKANTAAWRLRQRQGRERCAVTRLQLGAERWQGGTQSHIKTFFEGYLVPWFDKTVAMWKWAGTTQGFTSCQLQKGWVKQAPHSDLQHLFNFAFRRWRGERGEGRKTGQWWKTPTARTITLL